MSLLATRAIRSIATSPRKRALFCASMLGGMLAAASAVASPVLPSGGHVAAGSAAIGGASGASLTISQTSSKAIVDWSSFSIGQGGTVQFDNGSGATLNRVTGANVSSIDGLLSATGSVYLINPNGVIVGKTGVVGTGGSFAASTLDVSNASFLAGGPLTFSGPSTASVINLGKVGSLGGNVGLIAATVRNDGTITAPKGDAGLAAGTTVTLDDTANDAGGLFSVKVGDASTSATNAGAISAAAVELRAQQGNVYALAGNAGGVIDATGVDASGGTIKLISTGGTTDVTGTLSAQGPNGAGGQIETSGASLDIGVASVDTHGGSWLLDPTSLIVNAAAASTIDAALGSGNVTLATNASGPPTGPGVPGDNSGEILIDAPLTWASSTTLTLNSVGDIIVNAPISVTGGGAVALDFITSGLKFVLGPTGFVGSLSFAAGTGEGITGQSLTVNGTSYKLLYSMADIAGITATGGFALARPITSTTTYTSAVVAPQFSGTLEGLGNTISGLTINSSNSDVGLIGTLNGGQVRDIGLVGGTVEAFSAVGALVGYNLSGTVAASYATGAVFAVNEEGGLVGVNTGSIESSYATGAVAATQGAVGGLVGLNVGTVDASYATGAVSGFEEVGGLVGFSQGSAAGFGQPSHPGLIEASHATGAVSGVSATSVASSDVGGLVGLMEGGTVETSNATGAVSGSANVGGLVGDTSIGGAVNTFQIVGSFATGAVSGTSQVGGLIGDNGAATVETSHAAGEVSGASEVGGLIGANAGQLVGTSYATGAVSGTSEIGGFVGYNKAPIQTSYATGAVSGNEDIGGLVGYNDLGGSVAMSYATGAISGVTFVGGLVGYNVGVGDISNAYFDTQTAFSSGTGPGEGGGNPTTGITGLTTVQLQSNAGGFMTNLGSAFAGGTGGLFPYLVHFFPSGVQALVGTATSGGSPAGAVQVGLYAGGVLLGGGAVSTGADGSIYAIVAAGTLGASGDKIGADLTPAGGSSPTGFVYTDTESVAAGILTLPALAAGQNVQTTGELTQSALDADLGKTFGASTYAGLQTALAAVPTTISPTGASFTVNQAVSAAGLSIQTFSLAPLTITAPITVSGTGALTLDTNGALAIDAPIQVGGGQVTLDFFGALSFDLGLSSFAGSLSFAAGTGEGIPGQALTLNGTSYTLLFSMADVAAMGTTGHFALARPLASTTTYTGAVVASFGGTLMGLGNSITGLTINGGGASEVGLIGMLFGDVLDIGLVGGSVSGLDDVGGLVGLSEGFVTSSHVSDNVSGAGAGFGIGGMVGDDTVGSAILSSSASGKVTGADGDRDVGGLVGVNAGALTNDMAFGRVMSAASLYVGGLVGFNAAAGTINGAFASGAVSAPGSSTAAIGGLAGYNAGTISNTYAYTGAVSGAKDVGGLVGYDVGSVSTSWSSGAVSGTTNIGGSIGLQSGGALASLYWDEGLSGQTTGVGSGASAGVTGIGGTTGLSPTAQSTYGGFDFVNVWNIIAGSSRPFLRSLFP